MFKKTLSFTFFIFWKNDYMAPFQWPKVEDIIALCKQYLNCQPKKHEDWEYLASALSTLFDLNEPLNFLIKKYKAKERKALKR